jgi:hypothetical protein
VKVVPTDTAKKLRSEQPRTAARAARRTKLLPASEPTNRWYAGGLRSVENGNLQKN